MGTRLTELYIWDHTVLSAAGEHA